jgi:hypothetical protein
MQNLSAKPQDLAQTADRIHAVTPRQDSQQQCRLNIADAASLLLLVGEVGFLDVSSAVPRRDGFSVTSN